MAAAGMLERWSFPPGEHSGNRMALSAFSEDKEVVLLPGKLCSSDGLHFSSRAESLIWPSQCVCSIFTDRHQLFVKTTLAVSSEEFGRGAIKSSKIY
jgi:hypothetical protein